MAGIDLVVVKALAESSWGTFTHGEYSGLCIGYFCGCGSKINRCNFRQTPDNITSTGGCRDIEAHVETLPQAEKVSATNFFSIFTQGAKNKTREIPRLGLAGSAVNARDPRLTLRAVIRPDNFSSLSFLKL